MSSLSKKGLDSMVSGLIIRHQQAGVALLVLLYVDSECCIEQGQTRVVGWPNLNISLDIWHFLLQLETGCTSVGMHL